MSNPNNHNSEIAEEASPATIREDGNKTPIISVQDLVVTLRGTDRTAPHDIHYGEFKINSGDFVLIKGRNGSGKSTFLNLFHLQGNEYFDIKSGKIIFHEDGFPEISIHNYSNRQKSHLNRAISFIGQEENFPDYSTAYSYIYGTCKTALEDNRFLTGEQKAEALEKADELLYQYYKDYLSESFGPDYTYKQFRNRYINGRRSKYSGGQKKMFHVLEGIIKAQVCGLKLILMDEPLNNLDGKNKYILNKLIKQLREETGVTILVVTHCQIFEDVNKILLISEEHGVHRATLRKCKEFAHSECLEEYN